MSMIKTDNLIFEYEKRDEEGNVVGTHRAIDEVNLDIEPGQFIAILGHNGSGKSTLAKHMNAILVPSGGTMWVDGEEYKGRRQSVGCQTERRNGISKSGQSDYRNSCGGRCRIWSGESWCSDRRNLAACGEKPLSSWHDCVSPSFTE